MTRDERLSPGLYEFTLTTTLTQATQRAVILDRSAARPGRSPQDQPYARAILRKGNDVTKGKNREALVKGKQVKHEDKPEKMKARARRKDKRSNPGDKIILWKDKHR